MSEHSLEELREKFPSAALELDLVSGRVNPETGEKIEDFKSDEMQDWIEKCVLDVLDLIDNQGHSSFSHGYLLTLLIPLLKDKPISPLTGNDWEWDNKYGLIQNKRCFSVFKDPDGSAYYTEGYAFSDNKTITFPCDNKQLETEYVILKKE